MIAFFAFAFISEMIATTVGFGASTILLPFALFFFDFTTALTLVAFYHFFGSLGRFGFFRSGLNWRILFWFGLPSIIASLLGARLILDFPQALLKGLLGLFLILYGLISLVRPKLHLPTATTNLVLGGAVSGFLSGLIGTGGALRASFLSAFKKDKATYLATTAALSLAVDLTRIPIYLAQGFLPPSLFIYVPVLFILALTATYFGKRLVSRLPTKLFEKLVHLAIVAAGVWFVFDWLAL